MVRRVETKAGDFAPVVIADGESTRTVPMRWGFEPRAGSARSRFLVRDDTSAIDVYCRCLVPATALPLKDRRGAKWLVTPRQPGQIICFAGVWQQASDRWPDAYAVVTVPAYPDLRFVKARHVAVLPQESWAEWLAGAPARATLAPWSPGTFSVLRS